MNKNEFRSLCPDQGVSKKYLYKNKLSAAESLKSEIHPMVSGITSHNPFLRGSRRDDNLFRPNEDLFPYFKERKD
ncbi:MAG: hypothetical protein LAT55_04835 [Opitutales bacterium]|nr:hypothetical protein [Opitutales bacterium]